VRHGRFHPVGAGSGNSLLEFIFQMIFEFNFAGILFAEFLKYCLSSVYRSTFQESMRSGVIPSTVDMRISSLMERFSDFR
jgi:hypothetical protein